MATDDGRENQTLEFLTLYLGKYEELGTGEIFLYKYDLKLS